MPKTIDSFGRTIYGPYPRKDGRKHVIWRKPDGSKTTISYPKWLMENHLGRFLEPDETVDHINRNFSDDRIENLQVLSRPDHTKIDSWRVERVQTPCLLCNVPVNQIPSDCRGNEKQGKAGPFCSKTCSGKYGALLQNGKISKLERVPTPTTKRYRNDKAV